MRRILPAILIAILFHVFLFVLDPGTFIKKPGKIQRPAITVTMSYKKKPQPPPVKKTPKKIVKKKKLKVIEKVKKPAPIKVKKQITEPAREQKLIEEKIEIEEEFTKTDLVEVEDTKESESVTEEAVSVVVTEAFPLYRENPEPRYPRMARKREYEGTVIVSALVNKEGTVDNLLVFESCGYKVLDNAAIKAVEAWTFEPGKRDDETVGMWVEIPVRFELK